MKKYLLPIAVSLLTIGTLYAQSGTAIVGCDGVTVSCSWIMIFKTLRNIIAWALGLGVIYAFFRISLLAITYGLKSDSAEVRKQFTNNSIVILIATFAFIGLLPLTSYTLKTFKVDPEIIQVVDCLQNEKYCGGLLDKRQGIQIQFFTHAYAQGVLPSPIQMSSPYDFAISAFQVVLQVLFIALIILWLYAGFSLVIARGNPTELEKAKNRLWYSFFITVILMLIQALLIGLAGTVGVTISK